VGLTSNGSGQNKQTEIRGRFPLHECNSEQYSYNNASVASCQSTGSENTDVYKERSSDRGMQSTGSDTVLLTSNLQTQYCPT